MFLELLPWEQLLNNMLRVYLVFWLTNYLPRWLYHFAFLPAKSKIPCVSHHWQYFIWSLLCLLNRHFVVFHCLSTISLVTHHVQHLFRYQHSMWQTKDVEKFLRFKVITNQWCENHVISYWAHRTLIFIQNKVSSSKIKLCS